MTKKHDAGLDGCDGLELFILCQEAQRLYHSLLPPQDHITDMVRLDKLRRGLEVGRCGGVLEVIP